jgi:uncharacterized protein (TIGR02646 family)
MKWIQKKNEPAKLVKWRKDYKVIENDKNFRILTSEVKTDLKNVLLREQGWICAYTGHGIDFEGSHIEHLKPQHYCKNGEDVDYYNLVACYPGIDETTATTKPCTYGAIAKGNWPSPEEEDKFVSPLDKSCETRFYYLYSGKVKARNDSDKAAKETIDKLNLNDKELRDNRRLVIRGIIEPLQKTSIKKAAVIKAAAKALQTLRSEEGGKLKSFYFVRIQVIENFIENLQK